MCVFLIISFFHSKIVYLTFKHYKLYRILRLFAILHGFTKQCCWWLDRNSFLKIVSFSIVNHFRCNSIMRNSTHYFWIFPLPFRHSLELFELFWGSWNVWSWQKKLRKKKWNLLTLAFSLFSRLPNHNVTNGL